MRTLNFEVSGQRLKLTGDKQTVEKTVKYIECVFVFDADWTGCGKTAVFENKAAKTARSVALIDDRCEVPAEIVAKTGNVDVMVYGVRENFRITTCAEKIPQHENA